MRRRSRCPDELYRRPTGVFFGACTARQVGRTETARFHARLLEPCEFPVSRSPCAASLSDASWKNSRYLLDLSLSLKAHMGNRYLPYGILAVMILQLLFTYTTPFQAMFGNEERITRREDAGEAGEQRRGRLEHEPEDDEGQPRKPRRSGESAVSGVVAGGSAAAVEPSSMRPLERTLADLAGILAYSNSSGLPASNDGKAFRISVRCFRIAISALSGSRRSIAS